jgi:hypothetical protein
MENWITKPSSRPSGSDGNYVAAAYGGVSKQSRHGRTEQNDFMDNRQRAIFGERIYITYASGISDILCWILKQPT